MLTRIDIENYMNLGTTSFVLDSKNAVVYGENGIGKTNLCRTMSLLKKMLFSELSYEGASSLELSNCSLAYHFSSTDQLCYTIKFDYRGALCFEELQINNTILYVYSHSSNDYLSEHFEDSKLSRPQVRDYIAYDIIMPILRLMFNSGNYNSAIGQMMSEVFSWIIIDGVNLCTKNAIITQPYEVSVLNGLLDKTGIHLDLKIDNNTELTLMLDTKKGYLPFNKVASTSERAIVNLALEINRYKTCSLLCIDEFDAFYHYSLAKRMLLEVIPQLGDQYILTTHNTSFLNLINYSMVYILNKSGCHHLTELTNRKLTPGLNFEHLFRAGEFNV